MSSNVGPLDPAVIAALYAEYAQELRAFLTGVLRDGELAQEILQVSFAKAVEAGHTARADSLKSWLFQVAYHEALAHRRTGERRQRIQQQIAYERDQSAAAPEIQILRWELVEQVRHKLDQLPPDLRLIVRLKIYEEKTFAAIAQELGLPLGTVVSRLRSALQRLGSELTAWADEA